MKFTEKENSLEINFEKQDTNKEDRIARAMFELTKALVMKEDKP